MSMKLAQFEAPGWFDAMTLVERASPLPNGCGKCGDVETIDRNLAEQRLKRWRSQSPFTSDDLFMQRLEIEGFTEEAFTRLLGESAHHLRERLSEPPDWLKEIEAIWATWATPSVQE